MKEILRNLLKGGKLFEKIQALLDEIVTTKEEKQLLEIRLRQIVQQHEQSLLSYAFEDRRSARWRETEVLKTGKLNLTQNVLAYAAIIAFFAMTGFILAHGLGQMNTEESFIIGNLTGMAAAIAKDIYGYYFGSSKGEHDSANAAFTKSPGSKANK